MASGTYLFVMNSGPNPGKTYELSQDEITIGRDIANNIVVNDAEVSRRHARLRLQAGNYILEDLGSTNGSFVNGQRLMGPHALRPGEQIMFGDHVSFSFEARQFDPNTTLISNQSYHRETSASLRKKLSLRPRQQPRRLTTSRYTAGRYRSARSNLTPLHPTCHTWRIMRRNRGDRGPGSTPVQAAWSCCCACAWWGYLPLIHWTFTVPVHSVKSRRRWGLCALRNHPSAI